MTCWISIFSGTTIKVEYPRFYAFQKWCYEGEGFTRRFTDVQHLIAG